MSQSHLSTPAWTPADPVVSALWCQLLVDSSLPIGSFVAGSGWEAALHHGLMRNGDDARAWLRGWLEDELAGVELPHVARAVRATSPWPVDRSLDRWTVVGAWREQSRLQGRRLLALFGGPVRRCHRAVASGWLMGRRGAVAEVAVALYAQACLLGQAQAGVRLGLWTGEEALAAVVDMMPVVADLAREASRGRVTGSLAARHEIAGMLQRRLTPRLFAA